MKPFKIKDPNKIYTEEELQKDSAYPLFDDFYIGENPENIEGLNNYKENTNQIDENLYPLEEKYIKFLPEYIQIFATKISIDINNKIQIDMPLTEECIKAIKLRFSLKHNPTKKEIIEILKKDTDDFYKKFGSEKAIRALNQ